MVFVKSGRKKNLRKKLNVLSITTTKKEGFSLAHVFTRKGSRGFNSEKIMRLDTWIPEKIIFFLPSTLRKDPAKLHRYPARTSYGREGPHLIWWRRDCSGRLKGATAGWQDLPARSTPFPLNLLISFLFNWQSSTHL